MPATTSLKMVSATQKKGTYYEQRACHFLQQQGLELVKANWLKAKVGELDLIMVEQGNQWDTLVFVEVRARGVGVYGDALMSITKAKQNKLIKTARYFLLQHPQYQSYDCRFDVVAFTSGQNTSKQKINEQIDSDKMTNPIWIQNAFIASAW